jgi:hypothetical protein
MAALKVYTKNQASMKIILLSNFDDANWTSRHFWPLKFGILRFDVETSSAATVQMDVTAEILYGDRTEIVTRAVGTPPENDGDANEGDPEGDVTEAEANEEEAPGSETPSGDADTPEESP